jgi:two-component system, chemotaxis family, chemotaxis protein CheY
MKRILVVDDEPDIRHVVADVLTDAGYAVATACNGAEALDHVRQTRPDAVLLDLMMPIMDGWSFLRECHTQGVCEGVPIGIMSAAHNAGATVNMWNVNALIAKPFALEELLTAVERMV